MNAFYFGKSFVKQHNVLIIDGDGVGHKLFDGWQEHVDSEVADGEREGHLWSNDGQYVAEWKANVIYFGGFDTVTVVAVYEEES